MVAKHRRAPADAITCLVMYMVSKNIWCQLIQPNYVRSLERHFDEPTTTPLAGLTAQGGLNISTPLLLRSS